MTSGCAPTAVLSYDFWQRERAASPDVLRQAISLDGHLFEILGVLQTGSPCTFFRRYQCPVPEAGGRRRGEASGSSGSGVGPLIFLFGREYASVAG